jgi:lipopolysaccharide/colanic/teichoic acid biosynthesis glycosyltransferase
VPKRVFDVVLTLAVAPVAFAVTLAMAGVLAVELRGNPVFVQQRIGLRGQPFRIYKLRTMRHPHAGDVERFEVSDFQTFVFSPSGEQHPRLTRAGAFARKLSIDELPNLVNVLKGDMSLVGPRPEVPEIVAQYPPCYHRRHCVRPGIAGLAQVNGRSDLTYAATIMYDLEYVQSNNVLRDALILVKTLAVVARGSGAR